MNIKNGEIHNSIFLTLFILVISLIVPLQSWGEGPARIKIETATPQQVAMTVGKSVIISTSKPIKRISLVAPEIADAMVLTPRQLYLAGKAPGSTTVTLWETDDRISAIIDLKVSADIPGFKETLHKIMPDETEVQVTATHESITLSGNVSSAGSLTQVLTLAESCFPKKVVNLLQVSGGQQVMLEVRVSEISRSVLKRLGINFNYVSENGHTFGLSLLNNLTGVPDAGFLTSPPLSIFPTSDPISVSNNINSILRFAGGHGATWTGFIDALKEEGLVKVLAEPTLITLSGKEGKFLAGGEFPIPVPQSTGGSQSITIDYKQFGVGLNFIPTVLSGDKINMHVAPEVSELDFTNAVYISGYLVPGLTTRRVSTDIELADGQSFAIAGLLKSDAREVVSKYPVLGDIPILGALFRSTKFQNNETELVIIVTPHLVKPVDMAKQTLPTDQYI
ncbi:MAG: type II and III secretion system protein family protein, partial [Desulfobacterium sp.]|nr:type II and III secretion system protein family protein [Desulfobacterium sp.]MBU4036742.1 type II and III secretion system protein family protein [Pseudomonadota bacterium]